MFENKLRFYVYFIFLLTSGIHRILFGKSFVAEILDDEKVSKDI